jgi:uncharacterized membrane protein
MQMHIKEILLASIIFISLDLFTLNLLRSFFDHQVKSIQGSNIKLNLTAALLCYIVLIFGLYYFIISKNKSIFDAFLFGFIIYAVYELTNKSLLDKWYWKTVLVDTTWGGILFSLTTYFVYRFR